MEVVCLLALETIIVEGKEYENGLHTVALHLPSLTPPPFVIIVTNVAGATPHFIYLFTNLWISLSL